MLSTVVRLTAIIWLLSGTLALAHNDCAPGVVKERCDLMERQGDDMKIIGDMAKGKTTFDAAKAGEAARDIGVTARKIHELFPEGSGGGTSEALPAIWEHWDDFTAKADDLGKAADTLAAALDSGDPDWKSAFQGVSDACKACHQDYRKKKEKKAQQ
jgi:cytochrome c556